MIYLGVDHHKKDAQIIGVDETGTIAIERRLPCKPQEWEQLRREIGGPVQAVLEAGWNWGKLFDILEELGFNPRLANPLKVRLIADSFIKTDRRDALALAQLLRMNWIPEVHVPPKQTRDRRNLLRQRAWLVQQQTRIKNRIHAILDRNHVEPPQLSDLFGRGGKTWMKNMALRDPDGLLLNAHLDLLDRIQAQIKEAEAWIETALKEHADWEIITSLPGIGKLLGALIILEIDGIGRFASPEKLCSYSGLVTTLYRSGETELHGGLVPGCNRHLRYAFVEAAWTAIRTSPHFAEFYRRLKAKKGSQVAIGAVARKLCVITFHCLRKRRRYVERPYRFLPGRPVNLLA